MKLFKYPKFKSIPKVRARNLAISDKKILYNFLKTSKRISKHGIFILGHEVEKFENKISIKDKNAAVNLGHQYLFSIKSIKFKKNR